MPFKKGISGNPKGKKPGTKSNKTLAWEELGDWLLSEGAKKYLEMIKDLPPEKFAQRYESLLEYFKPKQQRTELTGNIETGPKRIGIQKKPSNESTQENE